MAVVSAAILGIGVLLYPTMAAWFSDRVHATQVSGYVRSVEAVTPSERARMIEEAHTYNQHLPRGPLRDPYVLNADGTASEVGVGAEAYARVLAVTPEGMMGRLRIPKIDVDLPIYHGTSEKTLARGVGHLYGSAVPVGGAGTHAVLPGHSGLVNATLFSHLHELDKGDEFTITVLDEVLTYRVDQILTVLPDDTQALRSIPGEDHVTLVTCTPIGVNSHRLLVRGVRVPTPATATSDGSGALDNPVQDPGFPWWALILVAGGTLAVVLTRPRGRTSAGAPVDTTSSSAEAPDSGGGDPVPPARPL